MLNKCCNEINVSLINKNVIVYGWIANKISLKKIIFIKLRDNTGIIQIIFFKSKFKKKFHEINNLKTESCIKIRGEVKKIDSNKDNKHFFEIVVKSFKILGISEILPINLDDKNITDEIKLKYRYLYLRKFKSSNILKIKSDIIWYINYFMHLKKFIYIETPILSKPMIEGARNYLVKSKEHSNKFYSLSQSPQIFKQMLMISGFKKYYQFAKCFRDEDLRKNRQPEFTQLDIECSFIDENYIIKMSENLIKFLFKKIKNITINKIPKITYFESIEKFGSDKPDLRNPLEIFNINKILIKNNIVINNLNNFFYIIGSPFKINYEFISKFKLLYNNKITFILSNIYELKKNLLKLNNLFILNIIKNNNFELILNIISKKFSSFLIIISNTEIINILGEIREYIFKNSDLIYKDEISLIWINDFPLFKKNKNGNLQSVHHPFTSPKYFNDKLNLISDYTSIISNSYDLVINGDEVASGSVRINDSNIQKIIFDILKIPKNIQNKDFGFFLNALKYGTPPHAGIAFGLDRLTMIMTKTDNIKDVIAFPKSTSSYDLMINAPIKI